MNNKKMVIAYTTVDSKEKADEIARTLIHECLAACVTVTPEAKSFYKWQDKLEETQEFLLMIKTYEHLVPEIGSRFSSLHSYELPELIALPIVAGSPKYLSWIAEQLA